VRLDDPLLAVGIHEHHGPFFARVPREDVSKAGKIGTNERSSFRISSRTSRDPVLDRGIEPLGGEDAARCSSVLAYRRHDSIISL